MRIVIVEDSEVLQLRLKEVFTRMRNVEIVGEAATEAHAVALLCDGRWDAVLLDLQLKIGTGLGVLKALDPVTCLERGKIIVFTNCPIEQYGGRCLSLGADFFYDKSRDFTRMFELVADMANAKYTKH